MLVLKVPKCKIFDRLDFYDFYTIKPFLVGDFGAKIKINYFNFLGDLFLFHLSECRSTCLRIGV